MTQRPNYLHSLPGGKPPDPIGHSRPLSTVFDAPSTRTTQEREAMDKEYALLKHRARRRNKLLFLLPHLGIAFAAAVTSDGEQLIYWFFAITLATHLMIIRSDRPPTAR